MRKRLLLVWLWAGACTPLGSPSSGDPHVLSSTPPEQDSIEPVALQVQLDQEPRFQVDYTRGSATRIEQPVLWVGDRQVPLDTYLGHGVFQGTVPEGLEVGHHDLRVVMEDGREASWPAGYQVISPVGFYVVPVGDQLQDEPFTVTVQATGPGADSFIGTVDLSIYTGESDTVLSTMRSGAFSAGGRREQLTISTPGTNYVVVVERKHERLAYSKAFQVNPKN